MDRPSSENVAQPQRVGEGPEVVGHGRDRIVAVGRRVGVAVPALIQGDDTPVRRERDGEGVPGAGMSGDAVQQHQRRRRGVPPLDVVKPEAAQGEDGVARLGEGGHDEGSVRGAAERVNPAGAGRVGS